MASLEAVAALSGVLSSSTKVAILFELEASSASVGELCRSLGLSQSLVSHHLATMRSLKLVSSVRRKQSHDYRLSPRVRIVRDGGVLLELWDLDGEVSVAMRVADPDPSRNGEVHVPGTAARSSSPSA